MYRKEYEMNDSLKFIHLIFFPVRLICVVFERKTISGCKVQGL